MTFSADKQAVSFDDAFTGSFLNLGVISSSQEDGIRIDKDFTGTFINHGTISSIGDEAILFDQAFIGSFLNTGLISSEDDEAVEVDNDFNGSFINRGTISSIDDEAIHFQQAFTGSFLNTGLISSEDGEAVLVQSGFTGSFLNSGTVSGTTGIVLNQGFDGTFVNRGTILSTSQSAINIDDFNANSTFTNSGSIRGDNNGVSVSGTNAGNWLNTGIIEGGNIMGFTAQSTTETTGTFTNRGGRITGNLAAIHLGNGNATLNLEGPSHIQGLMSGGDGAGDTIRFQNIRGISDAKRAELAALVGADPTAITSITLFGETLSFTEFESVQLDLASLQSYEDILRPGLGGYGTALDHVLQLNDEIRGFLSALNDADLDTLNKIAGTTSGQVIVSGLDDFVQHQDANLFSLFANEFSTLRRDPSGGGSVAANGRNGLFTREVQVGVTIQEPVDQAHIYVTGFVGNGSQDPDLVRSESSIDNTSILFGRTDHVSHEWMLGIWGGYVDNDATVDSFGSALRNEAGYVGVNASYLNDDLFANFLLGYGFHDQLSIRRDFRGGVHSGDAVGNQALFQTQVGRDLFFGNEGQTKVSPYLGFALSSLSMGGFIEDGPALTRLRFEAESTISAQSVLGVNISTLQETNHGWIKPKLDAAWWHEFAGADKYGVSLATPGFLNAFQVTSPVANRDRAVIQAGLEFGLDKWEGVSFDATYFGTFGGDGYSSHGGALSATFAF